MTERKNSSKLEEDIRKIYGMEYKRMKNNKHKIEKVKENSIAMELGIEPGDVLLEINGNPIEDIFDFQYEAM